MDSALSSCGPIANFVSMMMDLGYLLNHRNSSTVLLDINFTRDILYQDFSNWQKDYQNDYWYVMAIYQLEDGKYHNLNKTGCSPTTYKIRALNHSKMIDSRIQ
jgi:hypothetical protein